MNPQSRLLVSGVVPSLCFFQWAFWHSFEQYPTSLHPEQNFVASLGQKNCLWRSLLAQPKQSRGGGIRVPFASGKFSAEDAMVAWGKEGAGIWLHSMPIYRFKLWRRGPRVGGDKAKGAHGWRSRVLRTCKSNWASKTIYSWALNTLKMGVKRQECHSGFIQNHSGCE